MGLGLLVPTGAVGWWDRSRRRASTLAAGRRLAEWARGPDLIDYGRAVADGLRSAGASPLGAEAVRAEIDADGGYRISLADVDENVSALFATALDELLGPVADPRYLLPRFQPDPPGHHPTDLRSAGARWLAGEPLDRTKIIYHAVPDYFGANVDRLQHLLVG
ncbi:hypothetical protein FOE78_13845 [Microlunatus elymi]|uniref:Uncharacterized protein n=1 Tax=Microlunatus elymi TaxID=2596828 RepID=A0A516Q082_9ACTN|nr:hypothetical protein [Microlunatus elymi]QDP96849.1 hypothetical protein FOE78_13845 [Microlunatus elymi]